MGSGSTVETLGIIGIFTIPIAITIEIVFLVKYFHIKKRYHNLLTFVENTNALLSTDKLHKILTEDGQLGLSHADVIDFVEDEGGNNFSRILDGSPVKPAYTGESLIDAENEARHQQEIREYTERQIFLAELTKAKRELSAVIAALDNSRPGGGEY